MSYNTILYTVDSGVLTITLNRPDVFNACNEELTTELQDALTRAADDASVRCVVLSGKGKAFCSGQDLKEAPGSEGRGSLRDSIERRYNPIIKQMRALPKPIIAAINGVAAGAGLSLALAADIRIMSSSARLVEAFIAIALVPDSGASYFYSRMMGYSRAFEFATMNKPIDAAEALSCGLVNMLASPETLADAAREIALVYAKGPTQTYGFVKHMLQRGSVVSLDTVLEMEAEYQQRAGESADYKEGVLAFSEKRAPLFRGQ